LKEGVTVKTRPGGDTRLLDLVSALGRLSQGPVLEGDLAEVLRLLLQALQAQAGWFFAHANGSPTLDCRAQAGETGMLATLLPEVQSLAIRAMDSRKTEEIISSLRMACKVVGLDDKARSGAVILARESGHVPFSDSEYLVLAGFCEILAHVVGWRSLENSLAEANHELARREFRLYTIKHVARVLGAVLDLEDLLKLICDMVCEIMTAESSLICLNLEGDGVLRTRMGKFLGQEASPEFEVLLSEAFLDWNRGFEGHIAPLISSQAPDVLRVLPALSARLDEHGLLHFAPLTYKNRFIGLLAVGRKYTGEDYTERDREFLSTLAPLASNAISNAHLYDLAIHDSTTGLYMNHYLRQRTLEETKRGRRYGFPVSLIMLDADFFKQVNDTHGHLVGDQVLRELAAVFLDGSRRDIDVVSRYGGEEFMILLPETDLQGALVVAERIRASVAARAFCDGQLQLTVSAGVVSMPGDGSTHEELLARADEQLYRAKRAGRNCVFHRGKTSTPT
jgi:diguanylate cyclase (GGDEF)-like protein